MKPPLHADRLEKILIVADNNEGPVIFGEGGFDRRNGVEIEVVCRLVEHQQLRGIFTAKRAGKGRAQALAAAQLR